MGRKRAAPAELADDPPVVLVDANVLFSPRLRDLFMHLHAAEALLLHWTKEIEAEWSRNVMAKLAANPRAIQDCLQGMRAAVPGWEVAGYRKHIARFDLVDPKDSHVAAAAFKLSVDAWPSQDVTLVTSNLKDFPSQAFDQSQVACMDPDEFRMKVFQASPKLFVKTAEECRKKLKAPPLTRREYVGVIGRNGCPTIAAALTDRWKLGS